MAEEIDEIEEDEEVECQHEEICWDNYPDSDGCRGDRVGSRGTSFYWFGECNDCRARVRQRYMPEKVELVEAE